MAAICRIDLDAFWSRATSTVRSNDVLVADSVRLSHLVGLTDPYASKVPFPGDDYFGYQISALIAIASRRPGRYSAECTQ